MRAKVLLTIVSSLLFCFSISADDIYYRVKKTQKNKDKKAEVEMMSTDSDITSKPSMTPEEFKKALAEFGEKSAKYQLDKLQKETIIGKLIQKRWYELNPYIMQFNNKYYVEYTLTERIFVGVDETGNITERAQKYYLSNKKETKFDESKVGWNDNGKYLIIQNSSDSNRAICLHISNITNTELTTTEEIDNNKSHKFYIAEVEEENIIHELSPSENLLDKTWLQIDEITGAETRFEFRYEPFGYMEKCIMGENRRTTFPRWLIGEYYFSNEIDKSFIYSKKEVLDSGKYIVHHIKDNGTDYVNTYEIKPISKDSVLLECVYPENGENIKLVAVTAVKRENATTLDLIVGKQWRIQHERYDRFRKRKRSYSGARYFTETQFVGPWLKTTDNNYIDKNQFIYSDFYLSDSYTNRFDYDKPNLKQKNGKYLIYSYNREPATFTMEIVYISENMLVLRPRYGTHISIYICD